MPVAAAAELPRVVNVESLVLRHDIVPTVLIDCAATAIPTITAQTFLDRPVLSDVLRLRTSLRLRTLFCHTISRLNRTVHTCPLCSCFPASETPHGSRYSKE